MSSVLIIRFSSLGDVVLTTGVVESLLQSDPNLRITIATKSAYAPLFAAADSRCLVESYDPREDFGAYCRRVATAPYDHVLDLHGSLRSRRLVRTVRAGRSARVRKHTLRRMMMVRFKVGLDRPLSTLGNHFDTAARLGLSLAYQIPSLRLPAESRSTVGDGHAALGIGWGARWATKQVPSAWWSSLLAELSDGTVQSVRIFGLETDREAITQFAAATGSGWNVIPVCGKSLSTVMPEIAACGAFISSDSGLMHVAAALRVPTIGVFGPTHPALGFAPVGAHVAVLHAGIECSPCHRHGRAPCKRERRFCLEDLDVKKAAQQIRQFITIHPAETQ